MPNVGEWSSTPSAKGKSSCSVLYDLRWRRNDDFRSAFIEIDLSRDRDRIATQGLQELLSPYGGNALCRDESGEHLLRILLTVQNPGPLVLGHPSGKWAAFSERTRSTRRRRPRPFTLRAVRSRNGMRSTPPIILRCRRRTNWSLLQRSLFRIRRWEPSFPILNFKRAK